MFTDETGEFAISLLILISAGIGVAIGAGTSIVSQGLSNGWDNINWWQVGLDGALGGISGALAMSGLGAVALGGIGAGLGFAGGVGGALLNGSDFGAWQTWANIGISTAIGGIAGFMGDAGARNATALNVAALKKPTEAFLKAGASYSNVLTKIATGSYKTSAGAAGARALTRTALVEAWSAMVEGHIKSSLVRGLLKSGATTAIGNLVALFLPF